MFKVRLEVTLGFDKIPTDPDKDEWFCGLRKEFDFPFVPARGQGLIIQGDTCAIATVHYNPERQMFEVDADSVYGGPGSLEEFLEEGWSMVDFGDGLPEI